LRLLERGDHPDRALPPFFLSVGADDVLVADSIRLANALRRLGVDHEARTYAGQGHAFQMLTWRSEAKDSWRDTFAFLAARGALPQTAASDRPGRITDRVRERIISVMAA
jgi:acetyl esterase